MNPVTHTIEDAAANTAAAKAAFPGYVGITAADGTDLVARYDLDRRPLELFTKGDANPKIAKGIGKGVYTLALMLAPSDLSGYQLCPFASPGCRGACLNVSGQGAINLDRYGLNHCQIARIRKARFLIHHTDEFMRMIVRETAAGQRRADRLTLDFAVRMNALSDKRWETIECERGGVTYANIMQAFDGVQFYDYTKAPTRWRRMLATRQGVEWPANYHLTFSLSETNAEQAAAELAAGVNVAVPFDVPTTKVKRGSADYKHPLPEVAMLGDTIAPVTDGDITDLRYLDAPGVIVGLRAKGTKANIREGVRAGFILPA